MNVNNISQVSCKANTTNFVKEMKIPMKDGSETVMTWTKDSIEFLQHKDKMLLGGYGHKAPNGISVLETINIYKDNIAQNVKEGFDFMKEFITAIAK